MGKIWLTSDTHFCHNKEFLWLPRGFGSQYEMNEAIVKNWNNVVNADDDVYLLGDVMLSDNVEGIKLLKSLKGKIHIVLGNHDTDTRIDLYSHCWNVVEIEAAIRLKYNKYRFFLCHYPTICGNYDDGKELRKHTISLCGHTHTKDRFCDWNKGLIYHVDMDAHNCTPVDINEVISDIQEKYNERGGPF